MGFSIAPTTVTIYFLAMSIITFVLYTIDFKMWVKFAADYDKKIKREKPVRGYGIKEDLLQLITFAGGALGTCVAYLVWDRHPNSINIGQRVWALMLLVVQVVIYLCLAGPEWMRIDLVGNFMHAFEEHPIACWYLVGINLATFLVFFVDKKLAVGKRWRIPEYVLLGLCIVGGTIGGYFAMASFQHKYKKHEFYIGIPMIAIVQFIVMSYLRAIGIWH